MTARRDPHSGLHTETGAMPGEHSGPSRNPLVKIAGLAWLEFEKPDLARAERILVDFGFAVADRSPEALVPEGHGDPGQPSHREVIMSVVAQQLAHQAPRRVRRLVLAAAGPGLGGLPGFPARPARPGHTAPLLPAGLLPQHPRAGLRRRRAPRPRRTAARLAGPVRRTALAARYLGQLYAVTGWTSLPWLHRLRQPTLVLAGDDDPIVPPVNGRILAHRIPNARLHTVHGGGHLFLLERPAEMAALVTRCLAERW